MECRCQHSCASIHFHTSRRREIDGMNNFSSLTSSSSDGPRMWGLHREINGMNNFSSLTSSSSDSPRMWGICSVFMYLFCYALCCTNPCLMLDVGSYFLLIFMIPAWCDAESSVWCTCCHDSSCSIRDPFIVCWWDTHVSPCMFALRSNLCHVGGMFIIIMHEFVSYW